MNEQQGHPHAELIIKYGEIARTNPRPWKEFEVLGVDGNWYGLSRAHAFDAAYQYRLKQKQNKTVRMYQWIRRINESGSCYIWGNLYPEGTTPPDAIQRIEPGFEIEVEE